MTNREKYRRLLEELRYKEYLFKTNYIAFGFVNIVIGLSFIVSPTGVVNEFLASNQISHLVASFSFILSGFIYLTPKIDSIGKKFIDVIFIAPFVLYIAILVFSSANGAVPISIIMIAIFALISSISTIMS